MSAAPAPTTAANQNPIPTKMPMAAVTQIEAAVDRTPTVRPSLKTTPAPKKTDAGHDALRHAGRIGPDGVILHETLTVPRWTRGTCRSTVIEFYDLLSVCCF